MKDTVYLVVALSLLVLGCTSTANQIPSGAILESQPDQAVIYADGYCFADQALVWGTTEGAVLRLPAKTDLSSLSASTDKGLVTGLGIETYGGRDYLRFPSSAGIDKTAIVHLRFGLPGVQFEPYIDADLTGDQSLNLTFKALIIPGPVNFKDCDLTLTSRAASKGQGSESRLAADVIYRVGKQSVGSGSKKLVNVFSQAVTGESIYAWDTSGSDWVRRNLIVKNPFKIALPAAAYTVTQGTLILATGAIDFSLPEAAIALEAGIEPNIDIFRSVVTQENPKLKVNRFRHALEYKLKSNLDKDIKVRVTFLVKHGEEHRNEYTFQVPPTATPGDQMIWDLDLAKRGSQTIAFTLDTDERSYAEYGNYENSQAQ